MMNMRSVISDDIHTCTRVRDLTASMVDWPRANNLASASRIWPRFTQMTRSQRTPHPLVTTFGPNIHHHSPASQSRPFDGTKTGILPPSKHFFLAPVFGGPKHIVANLRPRLATVNKIVIITWTVVAHVSIRCMCL